MDISRNLDKKYDSLALDALNRSLFGLNILNQNGPVEVEKKEILEAFRYSGDILRSNKEGERLRMIADNVFVTCIRLVRCLFYPEEARTIVLRGKEYTLDAKSQLDALRRNMNDLKNNHK